MEAKKNWEQKQKFVFFHTTQKGSIEVCKMLDGKKNKDGDWDILKLAFIY